MDQPPVIAKKRVMAVELKAKMEQETESQDSDERAKRAEQMGAFNIETLAAIHRD